MSDEFPLFEQAVDAMRRALAATNNVERDFLLEEALRLHHLAQAAAAPTPATQQMSPGRRP